MNATHQIVSYSCYPIVRRDIVSFINRGKKTTRRTRTRVTSHNRLVVQHTNARSRGEVRGYDKVVGFHLGSWPFLDSHNSGWDGCHEPNICDSHLTYKFWVFPIISFCYRHPVKRLMDYLLSDGTSVESDNCSADRKPV